MSGYTSQLMLLGFATAAAVAAPPKSSAVPGNCNRVALVKDGDTCEFIAAAQSAPTLQIINSNLGAIDSQCDNLFVGEIICLGIIGEDCSRVHVVRAGDVCEGIASNAGISLATFFANNPDIDAACDNIFVGDVLCAASQVFS